MHFRQLALLAAGTIAILTNGFSISVRPFVDIDRFLSGSSEIVIAECLPSRAEDGNGFEGVWRHDVKILKTIQGPSRSGKVAVATTVRLKSGTIYLICAQSGTVVGADIFAHGELTAVPLPAGFALDLLPKSSSPKEQVQAIFAARLFEIEQQLKPVLAERAALEQGIVDEQSTWFDCAEPVQLGKIWEQSGQRETGRVWLNLGGGRLEWGVSSPGKNGGFLFTPFKGPTYAWEFAECTATKLEELEGKPLRVRFYGPFTPRREKSPLHWSGPGIIVSEGQIVFARTTAVPQQVFAIQVKEAVAIVSVRIAEIRRRH